MIDPSFENAGTFQAIESFIQWTADLGQLKLSPNHGAIDTLRHDLQEKLLVLVKKGLDAIDRPPPELPPAAAEAGKAEAKK